MCWEAYAGGIIDGEGCIYSRKYKTQKSKVDGHILPPTYTIMVSVKMTDAAPIYMLLANFGGNVGQYSLAKSGKLCYTWYVGGDKAKDFLTRIEPWVFGKKNQLLKALEFPVNKQGVYLSPENKKKQEELFEDLKVLKHLPYNSQEEN